MSYCPLLRYISVRQRIVSRRIYLPTFGSAAKLIALKFSATATLPRRSEHLSVNIYRRGSSSISFRAAIAAIDQAPRGCGSIDCLLWLTGLQSVRVVPTRAADLTHTACRRRVRALDDVVGQLNALIVLLIARLRNEHTHTYTCIYRNSNADKDIQGEPVAYLNDVHGSRGSSTRPTVMFVLRGRSILKILIAVGGRERAPHLRRCEALAQLALK
ncbi:hypothetical protein EVAR_101487_1 [Eumeta japonica]|uniref:Uncharacterized protein n=1 Tax=Eumeta variegata TaxID=151549 RepID=A0A4C1T4X6_EUMVA|nr:hypothetical protein EVAR_101487_1 [Eumeta japonica]